MNEKSRLSFRNKLRFAFLILTVTSILVTGGVSYTIASNVLEDNALKLTQDTVEQASQNVDEKLNKLMLVMMTFMISQPFRSMLKDVVNGEEGKYYTHLSDMDNVFSQARMGEPLIHSIFIATPMGDFYPLTMNRNREVRFEDTPMYERVRKEKRNVWVEGHEDMLFSGKTRVVSLVLEPVFEYPLPSVNDVYVVVNIREDGLRKLIGPETESGSIRFLLDAEGALVNLENDPLINQAASSDFLAPFIKEASTGHSTYELNKQQYLLNYARLGTNDWTIMAIQSKDHVLQDLKNVRWMIFIVIAVCILLTFLISNVYTRYLLRPLQRLQLVMKRVESNDLTARFESRHGDELAQVGFRFNRMLEQIVLLIDEVKQAETNKRAAEIKALSAQMDPHFLYNTLNTIYWKLKLKQVEKSQGMIMSLSKLFQLGLNKGNEITTLDQELQHVTQYLELQAECYENLFDYHIRMEESWLGGLAVPRIMLQPLVENSILHGFESMESGGRIDITIASDMVSGCCVIRVQDNGSGMDETAVNSLYLQGTGRGYAIGNMVSRLQLYYGEAAELVIESETGKGTVTVIRIPLKGDGQDG
jgi:two-component system, sensor histidine kinase YesM